jgi:uncharacterized protein (TIGR02594 family)
MVVVSLVFRRLLVALALCAAALAASLSSASARSYHHHARQYARARHVVHTGIRYVHPRVAREMASAPGWDMAATSSWSMAGAPHEDMAGTARWNRAAAALRHPRFAHVQASVTPGATQGAVAMTTTSSSFGGGSDIVSEARRYLGGNPTSRGSLWCARFMNMVLERTGHRGTGSDMASSFASYGHRVSGPQVGAIAVMGHHVGIVTGVDAHGNPIMISGNNGNRVREAPISRGRIYAYVLPN